MQLSDNQYVPFCSGCSACKNGTLCRSDSSGMGLRLAKEFTERLGGEIAVDSVSGKGTTFFVSPPLNNTFLVA